MHYEANVFLYAKMFWNSRSLSVLSGSEVFQSPLWLPNPMSLAYTHTLFMQENEVEHLAPPKSVNYN